MKKLFLYIFLALMLSNTGQTLNKCVGNEFNWTNCYGTAVFAEGTYEGKFSDGLPSGKGTMTYTNGNKFVGSWQGGEKDGWGTLYYKDGSSEFGLWYKDNPRKSISDIFLYFLPFLIIFIVLLLLKIFANNFYLKITNPIKRIIVSISKNIFNNMKIKKILDFKGRASRLEYWSTHLIVVLFSISLFTFTITFFQIDNLFFGVIIKIVGVIFIIPIISVTVRRIHDVGTSAFMLIPFLLVIFFLIILQIEAKMVSRIAFIIYFVFMTKKSQEGINEYGPNPRMKEK